MEPLWSIINKYESFIRRGTNITTFLKTDVRLLNALLFAAINTNNNNLVDLCILSGANYFNTGLRLSCINGDIKLINLFFNYGANNYKNSLMNYLKYGHNNIKVLELLAPYCNDLTWLMGFTENTNVLIYLVKNGGKSWNNVKKNKDIRLYILSVRKGMKVYSYRHNKRLNDDCILYKLMDKINLPDDIIRLISEY